MMGQVLFNEVSFWRDDLLVEAELQVMPLGQSALGISLGGTHVMSPGQRNGIMQAASVTLFFWSFPLL